MIKKLLSLPENLVAHFHKLRGVDRTAWFCTSDPADQKLGSGGGTAWLLEKAKEHDAPAKSIDTWLGEEKRILLHAGGQSRRLPAYAPSGKILTPIPVFRWATGQRLDQDLLSLQLPLYEKIMERAPSPIHTLIASGDVYIRANQPLQAIPEADVICYGLWVDPVLASRHGVFVSQRSKPDELDFMLQKPSVEILGKLAATHLFLMDIGIWLLSDRAVKLLLERSKASHTTGFTYYDLYTDFGLTLGNHPDRIDPELNKLSVCILPLEGGEFYHYGTSRELISSTLAVQNRVHDQRLIIQRGIKPHPAIFVQNADIELKLTAENHDVWIENSHVNSRWKIHNRHIITGVPRNDWSIHIPEQVCVDVIPMGEQAYIARPYGFTDAFQGDPQERATTFLGMPFAKWLEDRGVEWNRIGRAEAKDIQLVELFPECRTTDELGTVLRWMISEPELKEGKVLWEKSRKLSADTIASRANLERLFRQRRMYRKGNWPVLAENYAKSVFYQINLAEAAQEYATDNIPLPEPLPADASRMIQIRDHMFRSRVLQLSGQVYGQEEQAAFATLQEGIQTPLLTQRQHPECCVYTDQIVWGRCPVRIDLAGGWTDTPPYCLSHGGSVVNMAIELNGQPPLQVYIKRSPLHKITLRSIDMGATEIVSTYEELGDYTRIGSPFSIPKAALAIAGFSPRFSLNRYNRLEQQLEAFGGGLELTLLSAIPAGSGLGTSSILAATVLGALSDFCGLSWEKNEICIKTLALEQLLTAGGGWQDQFGGVLPGIKWLETVPGFKQFPTVKWLPDTLFTDPVYKPCHLLYYTGITRTAKSILAEIVKRMFLNETVQLELLAEMKNHALAMYEAIQQGNMAQFGALLDRTWQQNKLLDAGTEPLEVEQIIRRVSDYTLGCKLPGAGGGGYLYMLAKDADAARRIREELLQSPPNPCARFVEMSLSDKGLQISRS